jgi:aminopeptidase N
MRSLAFFILAALAWLAACGSRQAWTLPVEPVTASQLVPMAPAGRLPAIARPVTYRVSLDLDPRETLFTGYVEIDIELSSAVTGLWLHGDELDVTRITATAGGETHEVSWTQVLDTGVVWAGFPKRLTARRVTLAIDYTAAFDTSLAGLFRVESQGRWYALAKSESIQARRFIPGFDEPGMKAVFEMAYTVPEGMHAIANTAEISREPAGPGFETIRFAPTRPLSTFLLSAAVGEFDRVEHPPLPPNRVRREEVALAGYTRHGKGEELAFALDLTPEMMRVFEEMLGQPYPYDKLDIIAAPQWPSGATELAGAITYREGRILKGPNAGPGQIRALKQIHAHEIAHMWFGNLVTPPWWDDLWLKEAFATWSETAVLAIMEPDQNHDLSAIASGLSAMALDSLASARAVAEPISRNEDIRNAYDAITYSKGQSIIRMIDSYYGPQVLRPALGRYIARYADRTAASPAFYEAISRASGEPEIGEVFRSFVTQPGLPVIGASLSCGQGTPKLTLTQSRYRPIGSAIPEGASWSVPVCAHWRDGANTGRICTLLREARRTLEIRNALCPDLVMPNAGGEGYYRFMLDPEGWLALSGSVGELSPAEGLVALDSALAAFRAGTLSGLQLADLLDAGLAHHSENVMMAALRAWEALIAELDGDIAEAARARVSGVLDTVSQPKAPEARDALLSFRANVLRDPGLRHVLTRDLEAFLAGRGALSSDLYGPAMRSALAHGGRPMLDMLLAADQRLDDAVFRQALASSLGSVAETQDALYVLDLIVSGSISQQVSLSAMQSLMDSPRHRPAVWSRLLSSDFPRLVGFVPSQLRRNMPRLARGFCDPAVIPDLEALFSAGTRALAGYERALAETKEHLTLCAAQRAHIRAALEGVL